MTDIYHMDLFEIIDMDDYEVMRVPGGWIVTRYQSATSAFVPFNNEFMNKEMKNESK